MPRSSLLIGISLTLSLVTACSASSTGGTDGVGGGSSDGQGGQGAEGGAGIGGFGVGGGTGGNSTNPTCETQPGIDDDGDGFSDDQGDCNDCDKNVNPGAVEVIGVDEMGNPLPIADEDCDMMADNVVESCDDGLAVNNPDPYMGAQAIDLCQKATAADKKWGVLEAAYVRASGSGAPDPLQWGLKTAFGNNVHPQRGKSLLVLSSGYARDTADPDGCGDITCTTNPAGTAPNGFPQDVPGCDGDTAINDDVALQLKLRAPTNATGYSFNFKFYSFEFPEWICTAYNDQFIALVNPPPMGSINGNVSFDSNTNPVSVNIAFFDVCSPSSSGLWGQWCQLFGGNCPPLPANYCSSGPGELAGTGFLEWDSTQEYAGGTSWLKTQAPVTGGQEVTIRFAIWDTSDSALDSTALVDNFQWIATGGTVAVGTVPEPEPK